MSLSLECHCEHRRCVAIRNSFLKNGFPRRLRLLGMTPFSYLNDIDSMSAAFWPSNSNLSFWSDGAPIKGSLWRGSCQLPILGNWLRERKGKIHAYFLRNTMLFRVLSLRLRLRRIHLPHQREALGCTSNQQHDKLKFLYMILMIFLDHNTKKTYYIIRFLPIRGHFNEKDRYGSGTGIVTEYICL